MDDILKRLGSVEADVTELKVQVKGISVILPTLATKADLADLRTELKTDIGGLETKIIKWMIGTVVTTAGAAFSFAKLIH